MDRHAAPNAVKLIKNLMNKATFDKKRPVSWSFISAFEWNKQQWYDKYVLGKTSEKTPELAFGSYVDTRIQEDPNYLPHVIRYDNLQHVMQKKFDGIPLIGITDAFQREPAIIRDYKTGRKKWDQKRADETGQLSMYCLLLWLTEKVRPEDVDLWIDWLPTHYVDKEIAFIEPDHEDLIPDSFQTARTMSQVLTFGQRIKDVYAAAIEYCENYPEFDSDDARQWQ